MPPQSFLAPRTRGFICRSCLSRLHVPQRQWPPWMVRNATNDNGRSRPGKSNRPTPPDQPVIRFFDETPDGDRREIFDDEEEAFLESVGSEVDEMEQRRSRFLDHTKDDPDGYIDEDMEDAIQGRIDEEEGMEDINAANEHLEDLIQRIKSLSDKEVVTEEDRLQIRELLYNIKKPSSKAKPRDMEAVGSRYGMAPAPTLRKCIDHPIVPPDLLPPLDQTGQKVLSPKFPQKGSDSGSLDIKMPMKHFPESARKHINALHTSLLRASGTVDTQNSNFRKSVWKSYLMCRSALLSAPQKVPFGIWSGLWAVLSGVDPTDYVDRMAHVKYLGDDLQKAGVPMNLEQTLLYIEALLVHGDLDTATEFWERAGTEAGTSEMFGDYCDLGVKLFCQLGQLDQSLSTAELLLRTTDDPSAYRILLPIIQACLASQTSSAVEMAWEMYIRLRVNLGSQMEMSDYDTITLSFLEANQPDLALAAFKDMMLTPDMPKTLDSTAIYTSFAKTTDSPGLTAIKKGGLDHFDSRTLSSLPSKFNNKYFFGSWMKKLIGEGELDAARKVLDLMSHRRIRPDARHVNGLIGAWIRDGTAKNVALAEDMAWKMINTRLMFVNARSTKYELGGVLRTVESYGRPDGRSIFLTPSATIETFCILMQQYRRRQQSQALLDLFGTLQKAEIKPNTYFMNELLSMDSKSHRRDWVWKTYRSMTEYGGIHPDFETFTVLWHNLVQASQGVVRKRQERVEGFPTARQLFAEMMEHRTVLNRGEPVPQELYDSIVLGFSLVEDQAGTAVALKALLQYFNTAPNEGTARTIILQLARLGQTNEAGYKTRRLNLRNNATKERISNVTKIFHKFKQDRDEELLRRGVVFQNLSDQEKREEALLVLSDLLRFAFQTKAESEDRKIYTALEVSKRASLEMGVPECTPWVSHDGA
ncbi:uncharacterized protein BP5553_06021 [Venustampulla echinocandica]|uniref:Pentatricopeptide repeat protein n=1 Tax=Venustampulla echinocandica TaxID=2656787 RepID=A0A370TMC0_9HELO|nr:uncharacterized protein BP5553_06021 [Venustampulla echinocandica]RDL36669.1 hypothetical protein BP5553_06021 [Venustampulla echinocandica]